MADVAEKPTEEVAPKIDAAEEAKETEPVDDEENHDEKDAEDKPAAVAAPTTADDAESAEVNTSKLERNIIRQIEYYFGDANLNRDKFLLEQISKDDDGGWVPLSVLLTFKRLSSLSNDTEVIANAMLKSEEGLVEVSEDRQKLRRHPERPIPEHNEERRKEIMSRTAYAKGFPLETDMSELIEFFAPYEKVVNINMRKYLDKPTKVYKFKGSVFVTFEKKEQTQEFVEKEKVLFQERELVRKWQEAYLEAKREEMKAKAKKSKPKVEEDKIELPKGTVLFFEGATEDVTRELLRETVDKMEGEWEIAYIDYSKGDKEGHIRFQEENIAAKFLNKLTDNKWKLKDDLELTLRTLSAEEEQKFLDKAVENMKSRRNNQSKHKGGGHGHSHHGNRKRRGGHEHRRNDKRTRTDE